VLAFTNVIARSRVSWIAKRAKSTLKAQFVVASRNDRSSGQTIPKPSTVVVDNLLMDFNVGASQREEIELGLGLPWGILATMKAQQAVAIRFVGRRVTTLDVPFF
jgi:hypothetical protein